MMTVKQKQWQLMYLGFYKGNIDGIWGSESRSSTLAFQREFGIKDDGVFGTNTEEKTREVIDAIQDVLIARTKIALVNDGLAGPATIAATKVYQKLIGIYESGLATKSTRDAITKEISSNNVFPPSQSTSSEDSSWWDEIEYFDRDEFKCKCGGKHCNGYPAEMRSDLVKIADLARKHFKSPATVVSGLRCKVHNANEGGVVNSQHMYGEAVDLRIKGVTGDQLLAFVKAQPGVRYAYKINSTNVHFDVPKGAR